MVSAAPKPLTFAFPFAPLVAVEPLDSEAEVYAVELKWLLMLEILVGLADVYHGGGRDDDNFNFNDDVNNEVLKSILPSAKAMPRISNTHQFGVSV